MPVLTLSIIRKDDEKLVLTKDITSKRQYNNWQYALAYLPNYLKVDEVIK